MKLVTSCVYFLWLAWLSRWSILSQHSWLIGFISMLWSILWLLSLKWISHFWFIVVFPTAHRLFFLEIFSHLLMRIFTSSFILLYTPPTLFLLRSRIVLFQDFVLSMGLCILQLAFFLEMKGKLPYVQWLWTLNSERTLQLLFLVFWYRFYLRSLSQDRETALSSNAISDSFSVSSCRALQRSHQHW